MATRSSLTSTGIGTSHGATSSSGLSPADVAGAVLLPPGISGSSSGCAMTVDEEGYGVRVIVIIVGC